MRLIPKVSLDLHGHETIWLARIQRQVRIAASRHGTGQITTPRLCHQLLYVLQGVNMLADFALVGVDKDSTPNRAFESMDAGGRYDFEFVVTFVASSSSSASSSGNTEGSLHFTNRFFLIDFQVERHLMVPGDLDFGVQDSFVILFFLIWLLRLLQQLLLHVFQSIAKASHFALVFHIGFGDFDQSLLLFFDKREKLRFHGIIVEGFQHRGNF
mmetsp:Transcript_30404/g.50170  ORF Transcript_30404/g.50170 Transcript_30404/m.50170 type:complete len:213 (-) Transcript_30404:209-847(-)